MKRDALIEMLKAEFDRKKSRNEAYSLRAFSKHLGVDVSNLSKIMSYQKPVGPKLKSRLARKIGLTDADIAQHIIPKLDTRDTAYKALSLEVFKVISSVHHYSILEVLKLKGFVASPMNIANRLGLTLTETKKSLERLLSVGLLVSRDGVLTPADESSSTILSVATSKSHRDQQREILEGAVTALETIPIERRSQSSMTMAIDVERLEDARALIKNFRRDMGRLLSDSKNLNEVYQLSISLYPVTKSKETL